MSNKNSPYIRHKNKRKNTSSFAISSFSRLIYPLMEENKEKEKKQQRNFYKEEIEHIENINLNNEVEKEQTKVIKNKSYLWIIPFILLISLFSLLGGIASPNLTKTMTIASLTLQTNVMYISMLVGLGLIPGFILLLIIVNPDREDIEFRTGWSVIWWIFFSLLGLPAFMVITTLLTYYLKMPFIASIYISSLISLTYEYLIFKLYALNREESHNITWEIFRFALVGIIATIIDLITTSGVRLLFNTTGWITQEYVVTFIAVLLGFTFGVMVNYILSITMVYKNNKKQDAKKWWGVLLFILLSAVGLGIGIGMESLFYNFLKWPYFLVFCFRTIVVLVWNYLSRKFILFK